MNRDRGPSPGALAIALVWTGITFGCGDSDTIVDSPADQQSEQSVPEVGATASDPAETESPLAGTSRRLVEFQSMDDSIGVTRPEDPSLYTMRLNADGTVNMRLDCNNATGTWSAESGQSGQSGNFEFGPLAMTRALCPPPSMDE